MGLRPHRRRRGGAGGTRPRAGSPACSWPRSRCAASPDRGDVAEFIDAFTGSNRFVIDYLVDEVLARQVPRGAGVPARAPRCSTGSPVRCATRSPGGRTAAGVLEQLDRGNLFVVPLDAERSWYRYHHLFGDVLRARLLAEQPDARPGAAPGGERLVRRPPARRGRGPARTRRG